MFILMFRCKLGLAIVITFKVFHEGGKGGGEYRSGFTENKTALLQFTKNITLVFHASRKIKENILENDGS